MPSAPTQGQVAKLVALWRHEGIFAPSTLARFQGKNPEADPAAAAAALTPQLRGASLAGEPAPAAREDAELWPMAGSGFAAGLAGKPPSLNSVGSPVLSTFSGPSGGGLPPPPAPAASQVGAGYGLPLLHSVAYSHSYDLSHIGLHSSASSPLLPWSQLCRSRFDLPSSLSFLQQFSDIVINGWTLIGHRLRQAEYPNTKLLACCAGVRRRQARKRRPRAATGRACTTRSPTTSPRPRPRPPQLPLSPQPRQLHRRLQLMWRLSARVRHAGAKRWRRGAE